MTRKKSAPYKHSKQKAILRPEAGAREKFEKNTKDPEKYRYDSSLAPELYWDESALAAEADGLLQEIVNADNVEKAKSAALQLQGMRQPFLNWSGKAEQSDFSVPSLPLFIHERLSTEAILNTLERHKRDRSNTLDLFGEGDRTIGEKIQGAYEHLNGWQNRMILGDSLQVMNSLLQYESGSVGGQVQMVYMDPPYGIKFGSNFQPYVRKKNVTDGDDKHITREPEMVKAYRDTWKLGVHSWLAYMRDRLLLVREMLTDSGSCFVQINDEHVHYVRNIMDEVFGKENFIALIPFRTKTGRLGASYMDRVFDFVIWYAKNSQLVKHRAVYKKKNVESDSIWSFYEDANGERRRMTKAERNDHTLLPQGGKIFRLRSLAPVGFNEKATFNVEFKGKVYGPPGPEGRQSWATNKPGMEKLIAKNRIMVVKDHLEYVFYLSDFPYTSLSNDWSDTRGATKKSYVVQTDNEVIQRCMLMTTDPGDLVFDPTCGSGTTAYVAEQWGRRWITADVSRVPLSLARQRLLTATYLYYELKGESPSEGFVYKRKQNKKGEEIGGIVPHVTLRSVANDKVPEEEVLVDKPEINHKLTRISGPFCVESIMPLPLSLADAEEQQEEKILEVSESIDDGGYLPRMVNVLRLSPQIHLPGNKTLELKNVRPQAKSFSLHAEATTESKEKIAIVFGPDSAAIGEVYILEAAKEASTKGYNRLLVIAFAIDPKVRQTVENLEKISGIPGVYVQANTDLAMGDILKSLRTSEVFSVCGLPDIRLTKTGKKEGKDHLYQVQLCGLDTFDPVERKAEAKEGNDVPCWMLDTDYDGQCFRAGQVFFPRTSAWENIKKAVKADFEDSVWNRLKSDTSEPFVMGGNKQIAVKVIDDRGNELMAVKKQEEAGK